jgi:hypothetical protein
MCRSGKFIQLKFGVRRCSNSSVFYRQACLRRLDERRVIEQGNTCCNDGTSKCESRRHRDIEASELFAEGHHGDRRGNKRFPDVNERQ